MLDDILPSSNTTKKIVKAKRTIAREVAEPKKEKTQVSFQTEVSTAKLLNEIVWLRQYVIDMKATSQSDIVREALNLLAKEINYDKLRKKYAKQLNNYKAPAGRKKK